MAATAFISYSHADENALQRLHKHLAMLQREQLLAAWFDREILPGASFEDEILEKLNSSDIFIALVSPDYLASTYCYEKEFKHALRLSDEGRIRIVAIILEPCDWKTSPFGNLMALPKDGKPVSDWTNANTAYLDVVTQLRGLLARPPSPNVAQQTAPDKEVAITRKVRLKRDFDAIDRAEFADHSFKVLEDYFRSASQELALASDDIRVRVEDMGSGAFTSTIVNRARQRGGEAHITVRNSKGRAAFGDISFIFEAHASGNSSNGTIRVEADEYQLFLVAGSFMTISERDTKYSPKEAAEWLWNQFVQRAGIEYE